MSYISEAVSSDALQDEQSVSGVESKEGELDRVSQIYVKIRELETMLSLDATPPSTKEIAIITTIKTTLKVLSQQNQRELSNVLRILPAPRSTTNALPHITHLAKLLNTLPIKSSNRALRKAIWELTYTALQNLDNAQSIRQATGKAQQATIALNKQAILIARRVNIRDSQRAETIALHEKQLVLEESLAHAQSNNEQLKTQVELLEHQLAQEHDALEQANQEHLEALSANTLTIAQLTTELDQVKSKLTQQSTAIAVNDTKLEAANNTIQQLHADKSAMQEELQALRARLYESRYGKSGENTSRSAPPHALRESDLVGNDGLGGDQKSVRGGSGTTAVSNLMFLSRQQSGRMTNSVVTPANQLQQFECFFSRSRMDFLKFLLREAGYVPQNDEQMKQPFTDHRQPQSIAPWIEGAIVAVVIRTYRNQTDIATLRDVLEALRMNGHADKAEQIEKTLQPGYNDEKDSCSELPIASFSNSRQGPYICGSTADNPSAADLASVTNLKKLYFKLGDLFDPRKGAEPSIFPRNRAVYKLILDRYKQLGALEKSIQQLSQPTSGSLSLR